MEPLQLRATHHRQQRLIPAFLTASGFHDVLLGNPIRNAACKTLSFFSYCLEFCVFKNTFCNLFQHRDTFEHSIHRVPKAKKAIFLLLGTEIVDTQKSVEDLRDLIDTRLNNTGVAVGQLKSLLNLISDCPITASIRVHHRRSPQLQVPLRYCSYALESLT